MRLAEGEKGEGGNRVGETLHVHVKYDMHKCSWMLMQPCVLSSICSLSHD